MKYIVAFLLFISPVAWFFGLCAAGAYYGTGAAVMYLATTLCVLIGWSMASHYLNWRD